MKISWRDLWARWRASRILVVVIVFIALLLDTILYTCVIPILPDYLRRIEHKSDRSTFNTCSSDVINQSVSSLNKNTDPIQLHRLVPELPTMSKANASCVHTVNGTSQMDEPKVEFNKTNKLKGTGSLGILLASTGISQLLTNSVIGTITIRFGYTAPMLIGFVIMLSSTLIFAFATTYPWFIVARIIEGIGVSFSANSGNGLLSQRFTDDHERGVMLAHAQSGIGLGAAIGPVYGGVLYYFFGKMVPFLILAGITLIDGLLRLSIISTKSCPENKKVQEKHESGHSSLLKFARDPLILIVIGTTLLIHIGTGVLESTLFTYMMTTMPSVTLLEQSLIFLPSAIGMGVTQNTVGSLVFRLGRWCSCIFGLCGMAVGFLFIPWCHSLVCLAIIQLVIGIATGIISAAAVPMLPQLVQLRHSSTDFGSAFALFDSGICLAFIIGNSLGGYLATIIGYRWLCTSVALLQLLYAPLLFFLRAPEAPKSPDEQRPLVDHEQTTSIISDDGINTPP